MQTVYMKALQLSRTLVWKEDQKQKSIEERHYAGGTRPPESLKLLFE